MKIYDKGIYRDMTPEEIAALPQEPVAPVQTPEERIAELEAVVADLMTAMEALV